MPSKKPCNFGFKPHSWKKDCCSMCEWPQSAHGAGAAAAIAAAAAAATSPVVSPVKSGDEEKKRLEDEERQAAEEKKREAEAAEARRKAEEAEARRKADEAEALRKADEAEARRKDEAAAAEARRKAEEAEARRKADEAAAEARRKADEAEARRKADEDARRKAQADEDARRKAQADEDARRKAQADEDARRKAQADEDARRRAEADRRQAEEQAKRDADAAARSRAALEADRVNQEAARRKAELEEEERKRDEEKRKQDAIEERKRELQRRLKEIEDKKQEAARGEKAAADASEQRVKEKDAEIARLQQALKDNQSKQTRQTQLQASIDTLKQSLDQERKNNQQLSQRVADKEQQLSRLSGDQATAESSQARRVEELQRELEAETRKGDEQDRRHKETMTAKNRELGEEKEKRAQAERSLADEQKQAASASAAGAADAEQLARMTARLQSIEQETDKFKTKFTELDRENNKMKSDADSKTQQIEDQKKKITRLEADKAKNAADASEVAKLRSEIEKVKAELEKERALKVSRAASPVASPISSPVTSPVTSPATSPTSSPTSSTRTLGGHSAGGDSESGSKAGELVHLKKVAKIGGRAPATRSAAKKFMTATPDSSATTPFRAGIKVATMTKEERAAAAAAAEEAAAARASSPTPGSTGGGRMMISPHMLKGALRSSSSPALVPMAKGKKSAPSTLTKAERNSLKGGVGGGAEGSFQMKDADAPAINEACRKLADRSDPTGWVLLDFESSWTFNSRGDGAGKTGLEGLKAVLKDTSVSYAFFNTSESSYEIVLIVWLGEHAKAMDKARSGPRRVDLGQFARTFFTIKAEVMTDDKTDLNMKHITDLMHGNVGRTGGAASEAKAREQAAEAAVEQSKKAKEDDKRRTLEKQQSLVGVAGEAKEVSFKGKEELEAALGPIRAPKVGTEYLVCVLEGPKNKDIKVLESGVDALSDAWKAKWLLEDKVYLFVICVPYSDGYSSKSFTFFISWLGMKVNIHLLSKMKEVIPWIVKMVRTTLGSLSGDIEARTNDEVTRDAVLVKVTGSRLRGKEEKMPPRESDTKLSDSLKKGVQDLQYEDEDKVLGAIKMLAADPHGEDASISWFLVGYKAGETAVLTLKQCGASSKRDMLAEATSEFKAFLQPKEICFVALRIMEIPEQFKSVADNLKYAKPYWGLFLWHGPECSVMAKALSSHHWKDFCKLVRNQLKKHNAYALAGYHLATSLSEVNHTQIKDTLRLIDHNDPAGYSSEAD